MAFIVDYSEDALLFLEKLEHSVAQRIISKLEGAAKNPSHFFSRLTDSELYKLRVGDYRVLARIDFANGKIFVVTVGHRKNIYDK